MTLNNRCGNSAQTQPYTTMTGNRAPPSRGATVACGGRVEAALRAGNVGTALAKRLAARSRSDAQLLARCSPARDDRSIVRRQLGHAGGRRALRCRGGACGVVVKTALEQAPSKARR